MIGATYFALEILLASVTVQIVKALLRRLRR